MEGNQVLKSQLEPLRNFLKKNSIAEREVEFIKSYLSNITLISGLTYKTRIQKLQRVSINKRLFGGENKRIEEISFLKYPPKKFVQKYGRANSPNESVLYATFDPLTALSEMRPDIGDLITVSTWKLKSNHPITVSPIFKNSTKDGIVHNEVSTKAKIHYNQQRHQYDEEIQKQLDIIIQFVADCFSKEVDDANHFDYFLSSYYANRIFWELQDGEIDAILYPSVRQSLEMTNVAMKPDIFDQHYELELVEESVVKQNKNKASTGWHMLGTGYSKTFESEKIKWDN